MPELPEVQTVVTTLQPHAVGQKITGVHSVRTDILSPPGLRLLTCLKNRTITSIDRRAKRIVFTLDDGNRFYIHLGMTGRLTAGPPDAPTLPHTHLVLSLGDVEIRFRDPRRFGGIFWLGHNPCDDKIGPEPLTISANELLARLKKTRRAIKTALLDQRLIAGIGNIYADEALFHAGIHPRRLTHRLNPDEVRRLTQSIKRVLRQAIKAKGSTLRDYVAADNQPGTYRQYHKMYDRAGQPCRKCNTTIKRIVLGGRSTCFCPNCQPRR